MEKHNEAEGVRENLPRLPYGVASMADIISVLLAELKRRYPEFTTEEEKHETENIEHHSPDGTHC